jgi:hypothetical protein
VICEVDYVEVAIWEFVVNRLFVMTVIVDEPNAIQTVHSTVIADAKYSAVLFTKGGAPAFISDPHHRKRGNWD